MSEFDYEEFLEDLEVMNDGVIGIREEKLYLSRPDPFTKYSDRLFRRKYRFSKAGVEKLYERIGHTLHHGGASNRGLPVSPILQLLAALNLYSKGSYQDSVAELHGISQPTMSRIINRVSMALAELRPEVIKFSNSLPELQEEMAAFYRIGRFPKVIGCIDCTHVKILNPGGQNAQGFINRKNFFSINVQIVSGADLKIKNIVARWRGSTHDSRIFNESNLKAKFEDGYYRGVLLGDSGYACQPYLLTPVRNPQTPAEVAYNAAHIRTRNVVERLFGVWKMTFRSLYRGLNANLVTCKAMIVAMAVLHNLRIDYRMEDLDTDTEEEDEEQEAEDLPEVEQQMGIAHRGNRYRRWFLETYF